MKYLWTEDSGAGFHFWQLVNHIFYDDVLIVESKGSNQGILNELSELKPNMEDKYFIAFDKITDNQDIRNKYRLLKKYADKWCENIVILDILCFEHLILSFDKIVEWTGTGKADKIKIREDILSAICDHRIDLQKIDNHKTLQYISSFKRYSTERVLKSLVNELTENDLWSVKGACMGECWHKDCCISPMPERVRCNVGEMKKGNDRITCLLKSEEIQRVLEVI